MRLALLALLLLLPAACAAPGADPGTPFRGEVVRVELEGGFWGVDSQEQGRLRGEIPPTLREEGLRVRGRFREAPERAGVFMWGREVVFTELEADEP